MIVAAAAACATLSLAGESDKSSMNSCVKEQIRESSVVLPGGYYADPGKVKMQSAKDACEYEKATNPKGFEKNYGAEAKRQGK